MLFGFIFTILTATFSLSSNNTVQPEGILPPYSSYAYERSASTGKIGQMTEGNTTRLQLDGWDGCTIHKVILKMHSNSKSGGGELEMTIGENMAWKITDASFSEEAWAGEYTTAWVDIVQEMNMRVGNYEDINILITASENSLYINQYTIEYTPATATCYTITFRTGVEQTLDPIQQSRIGDPVILPAWKDTADWYFIGWSESEIEDSDDFSNILVAGSEYIPKGNTYLWAVYSDVKEITAVDEYQSGRYVMTMWDAVTEYYAHTGMAMCGSIVEAEVPLVAANLMRNAADKCCLMTKIEDDMIYELEFEDSTLTITHVASEKQIGYLDTRLDCSENKWQYKVLKDGSLGIYLTDVTPTNTYALRFAVSTNYDEKYLVAKVQRLDVANWESDGFWLFPIIYPRYTSWPFGKKNVYEDEDEETLSSILSEATYMMHLGGYVLFVKDKQKYLLPQELVK